MTHQLLSLVAWLFMSAAVATADTTPADDAAPSGCPEDTQDNLASLRQACVTTINNYRATIGLKPLQRWCGVSACLDTQPAQDANNNLAHSAFGQCEEFGQNECPGYPLPAAGGMQTCLQQMWDEGPGDFPDHGHYNNMTHPNYTRVNCGFFFDNTGGRFWSVQDFR